MEGTSYNSTHIMTLAKIKFEYLSKTNLWNYQSVEDQKIIALEAKWDETMVEVFRLERQLVSGRLSTHEEAEMKDAIDNRRISWSRESESDPWTSGDWEVKLRE